MESQDIQPKPDNRPNFPESISITLRIIHAAIGVAISILGVLLFFFWPLIIEETFQLELITSWGETEYHAYYSLCCSFPFHILSMIAALVGGDIGARKGRKYLGASLGAILVQIVYFVLGVL